MDVQVQEKDGNLFCLRHQEKITMFIMDSQVPFQDTLLCSQCFEERNMVCTKLITISKAKEMIQEQSNNQNPNLNSQTQSLVNDLNIFSNNLMDYKNRVNQTIDTIMGIISQWINDFDFQKNSQVNKSFLQQLQQLHQGKNDNKNEEQTLAKIKYAHFKKLLTNLEQLYNCDQLTKCHQQLKQIRNQQITQIDINQVANIPDKPIVRIQEQEVVNVPKKCVKINNVKQETSCYAIAFNKIGSFMVSGCQDDIIVWKFDKGKLTYIKRLTGHSGIILCLVFSKNINWFVSGSRDHTIRGWRENQNNWISTEPVNYNCFQKGVYCLLLNSNENELITGCYNRTIKVWNVDCYKNQIEINYELDEKHNGAVVSISLNFNETALVSCSDDYSIILWMKGSNKKWEYINHIQISYGNRICFVNDTQFLFQPYSINQTKIFEIKNKQIIEQPNLQINLKDLNQDDNLFPIIYNKKRQLIILKYSEYVYIIKKQTDGTFKIVLDPIFCQSFQNFGTLSEDGEYLVIWDYRTKEFIVHQISY